MEVELNTGVMPRRQRLFSLYVNYQVLIAFTKSEFLLCIM
jgi:hypothetical protein